MRELAVSALRTFLDAHPDTVLLDVREPWEVARAAIRPAGAVTLDIPMQQIPARLDEVPATAAVVCICHHGARSAQVAAFLVHHERQDVFNLTGGIDAWSLEIDPTVPRY